MKAIMTHTTVTSGAKAAMLGLALISLASCSNSGDETTPQATSGGSAGAASPLVFINNTGDKTLTSVALKGDSGNAVVGTIPAAAFENVALGDMQFSGGNWLFLNLAASNKVATIDPLTAATPVHEANLVTGTGPVHIYRDSNNQEVIWSMNDGDNAGGTTTPGDDLINCNNPARVGGPVVGGSVTALHNSHLGPGATPPVVLGTTCLLADGHKVAAFSSGAGIPKRVFVTSEDAGEMAVLNDDEASPDYRKMIKRVDLCNSAKETTPCNNESATPITTAFTPNSSGPHGIRWSKLTKKVYSVQTGYSDIVEIDPTTLAITKTFDLTGSPYTRYGMSPDGRFLLLRGETTTPQAAKLGVIDLGTAGTPRTDFIIPEFDGTSTSFLFKFSPDGKRFYILAGNTPASTKKDRLFAFDASTLTATPPALTLIKEIQLVAGGDSVGFSSAHSLDVLAQGTGEAKYIVVSNRTDNSLSIINATDNVIKQTVPNVGSLPDGVLVYAPGTAAAGNQATASLTGGSQAKPSALPDQLDDHGMQE
jgi:DNA-binding beta-propeller fold protein YncE